MLPVGMKSGSNAHQEVRKGDFFEEISLKAHGRALNKDEAREWLDEFLVKQQDK